VGDRDARWLKKGVTGSKGHDLVRAPDLDEATVLVARNAATGIGSIEIRALT
jgi:hypothetical protein